MSTYPTTGILERRSEHPRQTWPHLEHQTGSPPGSLPTNDAFFVESGSGRYRRITVRDLPPGFIAKIRIQHHSQRTAQSTTRPTGVESMGFRTNRITYVGELHHAESQPRGIPLAWAHPYPSGIYQIPNTIARAKSEKTVSLKALSWPDIGPTPENSQQHPSRLESEFKDYVHQAQGEIFADGMNSTFSDRVHQSIKEHGPIAVSIWEQVINETGNASETGEEFLRQLGILRDCPSHEARLQTLANCLEHPDPRIRDAAGLGLSFLDDAKALPMLKNAHTREAEPWLKRNFAQVIEQLDLSEWPGS